MDIEKAEALFAHNHSCGAPRRLQYKWPLALDLIVAAFRSIREKQALHWFVGIFERTGPTFEQKILGNKDIDTVEPANIESLLSTKFSGKII